MCALLDTYSLMSGLSWLVSMRFMAVLQIPTLGRLTLYTVKGLLQPKLRRTE